MDHRITDLLKSFTDDAEVIRLLSLSVGRVLQKELDRGNSLPEDRRKIAHIVDWLTASLVNQAAWLGNLDSEGRPKKLMKYGTLDAISNDADKAMRRANSSGNTQFDETDIRKLADLGEGMTVVELLTVEALDKESAIMQHCLGSGAHDDRLRAGNHAYYSIRDAKGSPHVTIEVYKKKRFAIEISGKQNKVPVERYLAATIQAARKLDFQIQDLDVFLDRNGDVFSKDDLPSWLQVQGSLDLSSRFKRGKLPDVLGVEYDLNLNGRRDIFKLPAILSVGGSIFATECGVQDWRSVTMVMGHLDLRRSAAELLPEKLAVGGDLKLSGTRVKRLPRDMGIGRDLDLAVTEIEEWPEELFVRGVLTVGPSRNPSLPKGTEVGTLNLSGSPLRDLPEGLVIHGDLILNGPLLGSGKLVVPDDISLGGKVKAIRGRPNPKNVGADYFNGYPCDVFTLDEYRVMLENDFIELPF